VSLRTAWATLLDPVSKSKPKKKKKGYINKFYVYCTIILEERDRQAGRQAWVLSLVQRLGQLSGSPSHPESSEYTRFWFLVIFFFCFVLKQGSLHMTPGLSHF
jgi:hypothetical protein